MTSRHYYIVFFLFLLNSVTAQPTAFVKLKGHQFTIAGKAYYYIGTNYWYGGLLALEKDPVKGKQRLKKELDFLTSKGVTNLRVLVGAEGSGMINGVQRVKPALQPTKGKFDETILDGLDYLLYEMSKRNMKAVLYLSNNWEWSGGFLQYLNWNGLIADSALQPKLSWDEMRDQVSKFYTCNDCKEDYNQQVRYILGHTNKYNRKKYINDPTIMAWEMANEPRPMRPAAIDAYKEWITGTAALIKSLDNHHLVTIGTEGIMGTDESMELCKDIHLTKQVDYITIHIWPKNWSWFKDTAVISGLANVKTKTKAYIQQHVLMAQQINKPLVIEEFGLPRNNHSFTPGTSTAARDELYKLIFREWEKSKKANSVIAGCNFWAFAGTARPTEGQLFWKEGDDLMGDPPQEEQGLNAVFDTDTSTWQLIESFTKTKKYTDEKIFDRHTCNRLTERMLKKLFG